MAKPNTHPHWFTNSSILCDGNILCYVGSTKSKLQVDVWLANHPFYNDSQTIIDSEGRVERFVKKYKLNSVN